MAKARKKARKTRAKRPAKKRPAHHGKLKGRKVAKAKSKSGAPRPKKQGVIASAVQAVTDAIGLHNRLAGRNTFED